MFGYYYRCFNALVDGGWTTWSNWSACDVTCGGGTIVRTRNCSEPPPAHGGLACEGDDVSEEACAVEECPVDGGWSEWSAFGACSVSCGEGNRTRVRFCNEPVPAFGGETCDGDSIETATCRSFLCPGESTTISMNGPLCNQKSIPRKNIEQCLIFTAHVESTL